MWVGIFHASPAEVLRSKTANARSVSDCVAVVSDQVYWRDCMITHLKTEDDFSICLSQSNRFIRPFDTEESATASCGIIYAHTLNDITVCRRLMIVDDQNSCTAQFSHPLTTSTGN